MSTTVAAVPCPSPERERLAGMIESLGFGLIENLLIVAGQPRIAPKLQLTRVVNFDADDAPDRKRSGREYRVRTMAALFRCLDTIKEPTAVTIVVKHGVPVRLSVKEPVEI